MPGHSQVTHRAPARDLDLLRAELRLLGQRIERACSDSRHLRAHVTRACSTSRALRGLSRAGRLRRGIAPSWPREGASVLLAALDRGMIDRLESLIPPEDLVGTADALRALQRLLPVPPHHFRPALGGR